MMGQIFYWTGVVFWSAIGILAVVLLFIALHYWYDREISPSLGNLRFAISVSRGMRKPPITNCGQAWPSGITVITPEAEATNILHV